MFWYSIDLYTPDCYAIGPSLYQCVANTTTLQQSPERAYYCFVFDMTLNRNLTEDRDEGLILYEIHFANVF